MNHLSQTVCLQLLECYGFSIVLPGTSTPIVTVSTDTGVCVTAESSGLAVIHSTSTTNTTKMMRLFVLLLPGDIVNCTEPLAGGDYHVTVFTIITLPPFHSGVVTVVTVVPPPTTSNPITCTFILIELAKSVVFLLR